MSDQYADPHYANPVFVNPAEEEFGREWAFFSPDGSAYKGTWKNALRHGYGVHVYANGDLYKGEFKCNLPDGVGQYYQRYEKLPQHSKKTIDQLPEQMPDVYQLVYDGQWEKGRRQGFGRFYYSSESFYCGYWHSNMRHGKGVLFYSPDIARDTILTAEVKDADSHVVIHKEDKRPEIKRRTTDFGAIFIGNFVEDMRVGSGRVIYSNGDVFLG